MIECLESPLAAKKTHGQVVARGRKELTMSEINDRCRNGISLTAPNLCLVPVDAIYEPIAAIPDEDGSPGDFLFIRPVENWRCRFTQLIEDKETSKLVELEDMRDRSNNSVEAEDNSSEVSAIDSDNGSSDTSRS
jgi:hypothetical protein